MTEADLPPGLPASRARRRALALGLLVALLAALGFGVILPAVDAVVEAGEQEDRQRALLRRLVALQAQAPALRAELATVEAELSAPEVLLRAPSPSQAAALLLGAVRGVLEAEGIAMDSAQALPPVAQGSLLRVGLRFEFRASIQPFHRVVKRLEAHRPNLVVRDALMAAGGRGRSSGGEALSVRMDVVGLARVDGSAS